MFRLLLTLSLVGFAFCQSNSTNDTRHPRIIGGAVASINQFPYIASIRRFGVLGNIGSGTLIHRRWVISAATITNQFPRREDLGVALGIRDYGRPVVFPGWMERAQEIIVHNGFAITANGPINNLALIRIPDAPCHFAAISSLYVWGRRQIPLFNGLVAGWGPFNIDRDPDTVLRFRNVAGVVCPAPLAANENLMCVESTFCSSDVGGPVVTAAGLVGVNSVASCGAAAVGTDPAPPDVFSRMSHYRDWIIGLIGII